MGEVFNIYSTGARTSSRIAVTKAFAYLRTVHAIEARMRYQHCRVCAVNAINMKTSMLANPERHSTQFAFFTYTDDAHAREFGVLRISYGDIRPQSAARPHDKDVGQKVTQALWRFGLSPEWDEDPHRRIRVYVHPWRTTTNRSE